MKIIRFNKFELAILRGAVYDRLEGAINSDNEREAYFLKSIQKKLEGE